MCLHRKTICWHLEFLALPPRQYIRRIAADGIGKFENGGRFRPINATLALLALFSSNGGGAAMFGMQFEFYWVVAVGNRGGGYWSVYGKACKVVRDEYSSWSRKYRDVDKLSYFYYSEYHFHLGKYPSWTDLPQTDHLWTMLGCSSSYKNEAIKSVHILINNIILLKFEPL